MKYRITIIMINASLMALVLLAILRPAIYVYAFLTQPISMSIESAKVFRNVSDDGDMAVVFHYKVEYSENATPTVPASSSIMFRMYDDDGTTLLVTNKPYVFTYFGTNGYGDGISSFYFTANVSPEWGQEYKINIVGLPVHYNPPPMAASYYLSSEDYSIGETQADNREDMALYIISLCEDFKSIYTDIPLSDVESGATLSVYGEGYFRGAIPGLQEMCPGLFFVQSYIPEEMDVVSYNMTMAEQYKQRLETSDIKRGAERAGSYISVSWEFILGAVTFIFTMILCIVSMRVGWGIEPGLVLSALVGTAAAVLIGDVLFTVLMIAALIAAAAIMYVIALKRA